MVKANIRTTALRAREPLLLLAAEHAVSGSHAEPSGVAVMQREPERRQMPGRVAGGLLDAFQRHPSAYARSSRRVSVTCAPSISAASSTATSSAGGPAGSVSSVISSSAGETGSALARRASSANVTHAPSALAGQL